MPEPINIIITGTDKTGTAFSSVSKGLGGIASSAQGTLAKGMKVGALAIAGLGVAAVGAAAALGAGIVKMTLDAAELEGVANTFDLLAESIGSEMTPALEGMREATRGMVSDADLMQAGNKFMAMGLANTSEEMNTLSEIATQLGSAMGEGPTESMENFALMLANQSIPRLDSFGISSGVVRERINELMESTEGMTRETAFMTAVMEQAEVTMARVGEQGATSASSIARIQATVENTALGIGQKFIPVLKEMLVPIADLVGKVGPQLVEWAGVVAEWLGARLPPIIESLSGTFERVIEIIGRVAAAFSFGMLRTGELETAITSAVGTLLGLIGVNQRVAEIFQEVMGIVFEVIGAFDNFWAVLARYGPLSAIAEILDNFIPEEQMGLIWDITTAVENFIGMIAEKVADFITFKDVLIALGVGVASIVLPAIAGLVISIGSVLAPILLVIGAVAALRLAWESDFLGMQTTIKNLWTAAGPAIESIIAWFQDMIPKAISAARSAFEFLAGLWRSAIQPAVAELGAALSELWSALVEAWNTVRPIFAELGKTIGEAFGMGGGEAIKFADIVKVAVDGVVIALKLLIAVVTVAAKVIAGAAELMGKFWDRHGKGVLKVVGLIATGFKKSFDQIFKIVDNVLKAILKIWHKLFGNSELLDSAYKFGQELVRVVISFLAGVISELITWGRELLSKFDEIFDDVIARVKEWGRDTIAEFIRIFLDIIREVVEWGRDFVSEIAAGLADALSEIVRWGVDAVSEFARIFADIIREVVEWASEFVSGIASGLADALSTVITWGSDVISKFQEIFSEIISKAIEWASEFVSSIATALSDVISEVESWAGEVLSSFQSALDGIIDAVTTWAVELYSTFRDALLDLANVPAEIAETLRGIGKEIINIVVEGIQAVEDFVDRVIQQISDWFDEVYTRIASAFQVALDLGKLIVLRIREGFEAVGDFVDKIEAQLKSWIGELTSTATGWYQSAKDVGKEFVEQVKKGITGAWQKFLDWLADLFNSIRPPWASPDDLGVAWVDSFIEGLNAGWPAVNRVLAANITGMQAALDTSLSVAAPTSSMVGAPFVPGAGGPSYSTTFGDTIINTPVDEEEFYYRVQEAMRQEL